MNSELQISYEPRFTRETQLESNIYPQQQQNFYNSNIINNPQQSIQPNIRTQRGREGLRMKAITCQNNIINVRQQETSIECMDIEQSCSQKQQIPEQIQINKINECNSFGDYLNSKRFQQIQLLHKTSTNEQAYSQQIITSLLNSQKNAEQFLMKHTISGEMRAKMIDWMVEVTTSYGFSDQTFFLSVSYMDSFFLNSQRQLTPQDLHLTGVASMFIACKYEEIYPLRLQTFYEKIGHKKLSTADIKMRELEILTAIDYDLSSTSILDLMAVTVEKLNLGEHLLDTHLVFFRKMCIYLSKMACHEYELIKSHNYATIAGAIIYVSFKILQQMYNEFNLAALIQYVIQILGLNNESILKASTLLLNLARNFERQYPNLHNLRKFSADIQTISATAPSAQPKPQNNNNIPSNHNIRNNNNIQSGQNN